MFAVAGVEHSMTSAFCNGGPALLHRIELVVPHNLRGIAKGVGDMVDLIPWGEPPQTSCTTYAESQLGKAGRDPPLP